MGAERSGELVVYKKISVQIPRPDEVLIHVKYSGVCHTDLHAMMGDWPLQKKMPLVGGHEGAGVVVAKGELVTNINVGDYASIQWLNGSCQNCTLCWQGNEQLCPHALLSGYTVDELSNNVAPILCARITVYKGLKNSGLRSGQHVAIVGAGGGLGCFALQYANAMGIHTIAIDTGPEKSQICKDLSAEAFIDYKGSGDLVADIRSATSDGFGPHAVLVLATHEEPFHQATSYVRSHGTVVCIGMPAGSCLQAPIFDTVVRMLNIKGSYVGNRQDAAEALEFFRFGLIKAPHKIIGLSQLGDAYDIMFKEKVVGRFVLDTAK